MSNTIYTTKIHENLDLANLPDEIWKDIPNYEGLYQASNLGRIKSLKRTCNGRYGKPRTVKERVLKQKPDKNNYISVSLHFKGSSIRIKSHQLVAMAFLGHKRCGFNLIIDHKDKNTLNNRVENLQIISTRRNLSKDKENGTSKYIGVSWHTISKKWRVRIYIDGKNHYLGSFNNEYEAHLKYQEKLKQSTH